MKNHFFKIIHATFKLGKNQIMIFPSNTKKEGRKKVESMFGSRRAVMIYESYFLEFKLKSFRRRGKILEKISCGLFFSFILLHFIAGDRLWLILKIHWNFFHFAWKAGKFFLRILNVEINLIIHLKLGLRPDGLFNFPMFLCKQIEWFSRNL